MKHYINYQEALGYFDEEIIKGDLPAEVNGGGVLLNNLRDNHIFTVLEDANFLFQREALISHHRIYIGEEREKEILARKNFYLDHFISTLSLKYYEDGRPGIPIVEDVVCDYVFMFPEFVKSLKQEGVYGILNCMCGDIYCGGLFMEVKHFGGEVVGWTLAYYQKRYPRTYLRGLLFDEGDYYQYLSMPEKLHHWQKSEDVKRLRSGAREVWIQLPLFFERRQLEELL